MPCQRLRGRSSSAHSTAHTSASSLKPRQRAPRAQSVSTAVQSAPLLAARSPASYLFSPSFALTSGSIFPLPAQMFQDLTLRLSKGLLV